MNKGYFLINGSDERMTPAQYGYWLLRSSHDGANGSLEELKDTNFDISQLAKTFRNNSFWAHLQFMAIYAASYWFYTSEFLRVPVEQQNQMKVGLDDCIKELRTREGKPFDGFQEQYLRGSISAYLKANIEEHTYHQLNDSQIYRPNISVVSKNFFEIICKLYPDTPSMTVADQELIGHFVADIPVGLYNALHNDIRISYVA